MTSNPLPSQHEMVPCGHAGSVCVELVTQMSKQQMKQDLDAVVVIKPIASNQLNVTQDIHKLSMWLKI